MGPDTSLMEHGATLLVAQQQNIMQPLIEWNMVVSFDSNAPQFVATNMAVASAATPRQFGMVHIAATILPAEGTAWVPCLPIIPLVIHAPGMCRVCNTYIAHLPHS